jgi:FMN phosphatase YigB (HAD superfamily)
MRTKVVGLDIYGTVLPSIGNNVKRKGLDEFLEECKNKGLIICTCSDAKTEGVKKDLIEAGIDLTYFDWYFQMPKQSGDFTKQPKNFRPVLNHYNIVPQKLTVIGDREPRDIIPARELGCNAIHVPEYRVVEQRDEYDLSKLELP